MWVSKEFLHVSFCIEICYNIMVYRKMVFFHWTPSWIHQPMYTTGSVDIYHMI